MKKKLSKMLGVGLSLAMLVSLMVMATPASADTLSWGSEGRPKTDDNLLGPASVATSGSANGVDIVDMAVNGDTIYAATGTTTDNVTYKSNDGGTTWKSLYTSTDYPKKAVSLVAVATDDPDVVIIADSANHIHYSTSGGSSWDDMGDPADGSAFDILDIDVSAGSSRVICAGGNTTATTPALYKISTSLASSWTEEVQTPATSGFATADRIMAVKFSPNYSTDKIITTVAEYSASSNSSFQIFWDENDKWNNLATGFETGYPVSIDVADPVSASIALPSSYIGSDEAERIAFVSVATATSGDVKRITDTYAKKFETWSSGDEGPIHSLAYHESGKLLAGAYDDNLVYTCLSPMASSPKFERPNTLKQPGGVDKTVVGWSGDTAVAATSGDESAFAISTDDGLAFNDISMIDTVIVTYTDVAPSADGSMKYYATCDNATGADVSIWVYSSSWKRIFSLRDQTDKDFIIRVAPDDPTAVYIAAKGTQNVWVSKDSGMAKWKLVTCYKVSSSVGILDMAVESADVAYAIDNAGCSKTGNAGSSWGSKKTLDAVEGANIVLTSNGDILVGGSDGYVAFSKDGGSTFDRTKVVSAGSTVFVAPDVDYADNNIIYAGAATSVKRGEASTTKSWSTRGSMDTGFNIVGMAQTGSVIYALTNNSTITRLYRALNLKDAATTALALWSSIDTSAVYAGTPRALKLSSGPKLWSWTSDLPKSITDPIAAEAPALTSPTEGFSVAVNPGTGEAYNVTFTWERYANKYITKFDLQIATDEDFEGIVIDTEFTGIDSDTIARVVGPTSANLASYNPGSTYYWRVRVSETGPMYSPWSEVRSFNIESPVTFAITSPEVGATEVSLTPTISWTPYEGAVKYEVQISEDPTFAILDVSASSANSFYLVEESLKKSTAYYWRARGVTREAYQEVKTWIPAITGPWVTGMFVTMGEPVVEEPTVIVEKEPAPPPTVKVVEVPISTPAPIPAALLWAIIVIGAVLVIALIVLIVRTRRVT
jgi:hypothetical protein